MQHQLSHGLTHYNRVIGSCLILLVLMLVQMGAFSLTRLGQRYHALTYLPSFLFLAVLSGKSLHVLGVNAWWLLIPGVLLLWGALSWLASRFQLYSSRQNLARLLWSNILLLAAMACGVATLANTQAVYHFRAHVETRLLAHDVDGALATGAKSLETDESLTMLRAYALSCQNQLGNRLFEYAVKGTSADLLPLNSQSQCLIYPADSIFRHLGAFPLDWLDTKRYLLAIIKTGQATPSAADYLLCGELIDADLDAFARDLPKFYAVNDSLPKHYREALTLYTHLRSHPVVEYHHAVMDEDFDDLKKLEEQYSLFSERKDKVREKYQKTYWYYYRYR